MKVASKEKHPAIRLGSLCAALLQERLLVSTPSAPEPLEYATPAFFQ